MKKEVAERWKRRSRRRENRGGERRGMGRRYPPPQPTMGSGEASRAPPAGSGAEPRPKTNLVHFVAARNTLIATICLISVSLNTAVAWRSASSVSRSSGMAFRLSKKCRYGVPAQFKHCWLGRIPRWSLKQEPAEVAGSRFFLQMPIPSHATDSVKALKGT